MSLGREDDEVDELLLRLLFLCVFFFFLVFFLVSLDSWGSFGDCQTVSVTVSQTGLAWTVSHSDSAVRQSVGLSVRVGQSQGQGRVGRSESESVRVRVSVFVQSPIA